MFYRSLPFWKVIREWTKQYLEGGIENVEMLLALHLVCVLEK